MGEIYSTSGVRVFHTTVTVWCGQIHNSIIKHTGNSVSFILHAKRMVRFILMTSIFYLLLFINIFNWQYFLSYRLRLLDVSQAQWSFLWKCICGVITAKKWCNSSSTIKLNTLWYVGFEPFFFLKLLFSWIWWFHFLFSGNI